MQDEQMDHIIREAAEKHHPGYNENAWQQMNQLLDKHLPEKEPKRRFPFFWLLLLLLGGGAAYFIFKSGDKDKNRPVIASTPTAGKVADSKTGTGQNSNGQLTTASDAGNNNSSDNSNSGNVQNKIDQPAVNGNSIAGATNTFVLPIVKNDPSGKLSKPVAKISNSSKGNSRIKTKMGNAGDENSANNKNTDLAIETGKNDLKAPTQETENAGKSTANIPDVSVSTASAGDNNSNTKLKDKEKHDTAATTAKLKTKETPDNKATTTAIAKKKKEPKGFGQNFSVLLSGGSDLSFIKTDELGKATAAYGVGLGYNFKRLTVRSGFYVSNKIYTAGKDEYHLDPAVTYFRGDLQSVYADCKIYEVPVYLNYNFGKAKNHQWFAGTGISTLLMKREAYDYTWKTSTGVLMTKPYVYLDSNKHYFSMLTLSGGYQYNLGNKFFLVAEPYVKLPLKGIGVGKIKLNSAGMLVTAGFKPFARKKK